MKNLKISFHDNFPKNQIQGFVEELEKNLKQDAQLKNILIITGKCVDTQIPKLIIGYEKESGFYPCLDARIDHKIFNTSILEIARSILNKYRG